jgi:hypothetical protein
VVTTATSPGRTATFSIVALLLAILAGSPLQADAAARLVVTTPSLITELSFDDSRLAWVQGGRSSVCGSNDSFTVYRYSFATRSATRLVNPRCIFTSTGYFGRLVLAGARAYWAQSQGGNTERTWSIWTTAAPGQATKLIARFVACGDACSCLPPAAGTDLGGTDGAGSTFLFSSHDRAPSPTCPDEGIVTASRLTRVTAGPSGLVMADVPAAPGSAGSTMAYAAGRVAIVPLENGESPNHDPGRVEIRDVASGALVSQFMPAAPVRALALSQSVAAVLTKAGGSARIEAYDVQTGALLDSWTPRNAIFPSLDIAGQRIVYRVGTEIRVLRIDTGGSRVLHRAQGSSAFTVGPPQIEGNRVVWFVRSQGHTRLYELILP